MMDYNKKALEIHKKYKGKLEICSKVPVANKDDLSIAYTPGVAEPCKEIYKDRSKVYDYTTKGNMVAIVTDGTAVLGLGDIGPQAALPVMEGKAVLFKSFANVDAFPICLNTKSVDEIVSTVYNISPGFGGINLEDIAAPRCFEIEEKLKKLLDIPVFHDDQHGTAIVVVSALINGLKLKKKAFNEVEAVINGAGSAGVAIAKLLLSVGIKNIILCDRKGALHLGREDLNASKIEMAKMTNVNNEKGLLETIIKNKDIFIGVSAPGVVTKEMVKSMNDQPIVLAMANPVPEIYPDEAKAGGAFIVGTGRSDFPNQVNNVLAFPGIFRGALDVRATDINEAMKIAAAYAIAETLENDALEVENILPKAFDLNVGKNVAKAVSSAALKSGISKLTKKS
jgi:malate dehydrogenase (oxaloacetate-decarboxylating)